MWSNEIIIVWQHVRKAIIPGMHILIARTEFIKYGNHFWYRNMIQQDIDTIPGLHFKERLVFSNYNNILVIIL